MRFTTLLSLGFFRLPCRSYPAIRQLILRHELPHLLLDPSLPIVISTATSTSLRKIPISSSSKVMISTERRSELERRNRKGTTLWLLEVLEGIYRILIYRWLAGVTGGLVPRHLHDSGFPLHWNRAEYVPLCG